MKTPPAPTKGTSNHNRFRFYTCTRCGKKTKTHTWRMTERGTVLVLCPACIGGVDHVHGWQDEGPP